MAFQAKEVLPGVYHIQDALGVCMTLLVGDTQALLLDTGYGVEDVASFIRTITAKPLTVVLTHGHHDHALGAMWFDQTLMFEEDREDFLTYTGEKQRKRIWEQARGKGLTVRGDYRSVFIPTPQPLQGQTMDLGGMRVEIIHCPGHTPGSAAAYVPERKLLLTGDDWNPCTWLFFPKALPVKEYRANVRQLSVLPYEHVLCSHQPVLFPREKMDSFLAALTDGTLRAASRVHMEAYPDIETCQVALPEDQVLVFDWNKADL